MSQTFHPNKPDHILKTFQNIIHYISSSTPCIFYSFDFYSVLYSIVFLYCFIFNHFQSNVFIFEFLRFERFASLENESYVFLN